MVIEVSNSYAYIGIKKRTDSIQHLIDDFDDKVSKYDNKGLLDDAVEIHDDITFTILDFKQQKAPEIFIDKLNGLHARFDDIKLSFENKCRCK